MAYQATFKRYEIKYLLTDQQKARVLTAMQPYMNLDSYGHTTIRNIYFDTDNYRLIRRSIEKPAYKEKLRIRSYCAVHGSDSVFVELKKKYKSIVYKRRLTLPEGLAMDHFLSGLPLPVHSQIADEIDYFRNYYQTLQPAVFLCYDRDAYYSTDGSDFRITFDHNIRYRNWDITLEHGTDGIPLLEENQTLMEIKTSGGIPMWMCRVLSEEGIFKTSFSKYGAAYRHMIQTNSISTTQRRKHYA